MLLLFYFNFLFISYPFLSDIFINNHLSMSSTTSKEQIKCSSLIAPNKHFDFLVMDLEMPSYFFDEDLEH